MRHYSMGLTCTQTQLSIVSNKCMQENDLKSHKLLLSNLSFLFLHRKAKRVCLPSFSLTHIESCHPHACKVSTVVIQLL